MRYKCISAKAEGILAEFRAANLSTDHITPYPSLVKWESPTVDLFKVNLI